eukprot:jgi/Mesvir1/10879/Mv01589-RA.4
MPCQATPCTVVAQGITGPMLARWAVPAPADGLAMGLGSRGWGKVQHKGSFLGTPLPTRFVAQDDNWRPLVARHSCRDDPGWHPPLGWHLCSNRDHLPTLGQGMSIAMASGASMLPSATLMPASTTIMLPSAAWLTSHRWLSATHAGMEAMAPHSPIPRRFPLVGRPSSGPLGKGAVGMGAASRLPVGGRAAIRAMSMRRDEPLSQGKLFETPAPSGFTWQSSDKAAASSGVVKKKERKETAPSAPLDEGRASAGQDEVKSGQGWAGVGQVGAEVGQGGVKAGQDKPRSGRDGAKAAQGAAQQVPNVGQLGAKAVQERVKSGPPRAKPEGADPAGLPVKPKKKASGKAGGPTEPTTPAGVLASLDEQQLAAVTCRIGPVRVVAGPGSGKTRVLTHRVMHLIADKKVPPYRILCITFTNKAKGEMLERLTKLVGPEVNAIMIGTFHSVCCRFLRTFIADVPGSGRSNSFTILDEGDMRAVFKAVVKESPLVGEKVLKDRQRKLVNAVAHMKTEMYATGRTLAAVWYDPIADVTRAAKAAVEKIAEGRAGLELLEGYERQLAEDDAYDFTDLVGVARRAFAQDAALLKRFQDKFDHVLVDEFQDTDQLQYDLIQRLAAAHRSIFVVGDVDQAIYGFRGSDTGNLTKRFDSDFPGTQTYQVRPVCGCPPPASLCCVEPFVQP